MRRVGVGVGVGVRGGEVEGVWVVGWGGGIGVGDDVGWACGAGPIPAGPFPDVPKNPRRRCDKLDSDTSIEWFRTQILDGLTVP